MSETVRVTFLCALGAQVRLAGDAADGRWRVIARAYEESVVSRSIRYQLRRLNDTEDAVAYEVDLEPIEEGH